MRINNHFLTRFLSKIIVVSLFFMSAWAAAQESVILSSASPYRLYVVMRQPIAGGKESEGGKLMINHVDYRSYPGVEKIETAPLPERWQEVAFDDSQWSRASGLSRGSARLFANATRMLSLPAIRFNTGALGYRARFNVDDPTAVSSLTLALGYRGGVVVYLNGREIKRVDMVSNEEALPYPKEAWLDAAGKLLPVEAKKGEDEIARRIALRERKLEPFSIPATALRKGANVLAIEVRRSAYPQEAAERLFQGRGWVPCLLTELELKAAGGGITPNLERPAGFQVWNQDINDRTALASFGDPNEALQAMRIVGARNGSFSAKVVVGSSEELKGLKATIGGLKRVGGGEIAAAQCQIRWGHADGVAYKIVEWFDGLTTVAPAVVPVERGSKGATMPLLLTVAIPAQAQAGEYRGELVVSAAETADVKVPVIVQVADWTLPEPRDFRTYVGVYQSPTTLALQYKVPEWSEEHWKLMERSFDLLGRLGNKIVNIPVVDNTQFGNEDGMVTWIKEPNGSYSYDFKIFDRFLDLTEKYMGIPDVVALQIWHSGGWEMRKADQQNTVTVLDRASGAKRHQQVPLFDSEESKAFWKPVLDQIRERLAKRKMEGGMAIGILSDGTAPGSVFKAFDEIVPGGAYWTRGCHSVTRAQTPYDASKEGGKVMLHEFCYGMAMADPDKGLPTIWKQRNWPGTAYVRHNFDDTLSLLKYRTFAERALFCGTRGIGRTCLDFWNSLDSPRGGKMRIFNRYPFSSCGQREPNMWRLAWPGPDGAEPTFRYMQLLESIQLAEALIVVAEAQGEPELADKIGAPLAAQCRQIYVDRMNYARRNGPGAYNVIPINTLHQGWQELDRRLFDLAGQVAAKK